MEERRTQERRKAPCGGGLSDLAANRIRAVMRIRGMSRERLAEVAQLHIRTIDRVLMGREMHLSTLEAVAAALQVNPAYLIRPEIP